MAFSKSVKPMPPSPLSTTLDQNIWTGFAHVCANKENEESFAKTAAAEVPVPSRKSWSFASCSHLGKEAAHLASCKAMSCFSRLQ